MDDQYLCPDCHAEHTEPVDAALGHVARCLTCELIAESVLVPVRFEPARVEPIHIEVHIAA